MYFKLQQKNRKNLRLKKDEKHFTEKYWNSDKTPKPKL